MHGCVYVDMKGWICLHGLYLPLCLHVYMCGCLYVYMYIWVYPCVHVHVHMWEQRVFIYVLYTFLCAFLSIIFLMFQGKFMHIDAKWHTIQYILFVYWYVFHMMWHTKVISVIQQNMKAGNPEFQSSFCRSRVTYQNPSRQSV